MRRGWGCDKIYGKKTLTQTLVDSAFVSIDPQYLTCRVRYFQNSNAGIKLTVLLQDEDTLIFTPNFNKVLHEILRMIDGIVRSVQTFARIDSIVMPDLAGVTPELLKVNNSIRNYVPCKFKRNLAILAVRSNRFNWWLSLSDSQFIGR